MERLFMETTMVWKKKGYNTTFPSYGEIEQMYLEDATFITVD